MKRFLLFFAFLAFPLSAVAKSEKVTLLLPRMEEKDTLDNRKKAAQEYIELVSFKELVGRMVRILSQRLPQEKRKQFQTLLLQNIRIERFNQSAIQSLSKNLTLREIKLYTAFLKDKTGFSTLKKMELYMQEVMPVIQKEARDAILKTQKQMYVSSPKEKKK